jgi:chemosensory pili system protein ChpA (sensor histidine kinase/response regulator)
MAGFTLDEVRETYAADMSNFVTAIDEAAKGLLSAQALSLGVPRASNGNSLFELVSNHGHAIYGSSSLIDLTSMMSVSRALEDMAARGHELLVRLEAGVAQARSLASLCHESAGALQSMLNLELNGNSAEAKAVAESILPRIGEAVAPLPAPVSLEESSIIEVEAKPQGREFSFEEEDQPPVPQVGMQEELLGVFREEAREFVELLQQHLKTLSSRPDDLGVAAQVERVFHTMKGAAATVTLPEVSALAGQLQSNFEAVMDGRTKITPPFLGEVFRVTNRLLRAVGLPEITLDLLKPAESTLEGDRTRAFFLEEAQGISNESAALIDALATAGSDRREGLIKQLKRFFHGLKGSALLLGDQAIADVAVALHEDAREGSVDKLRVDLERLKALIGSNVEASSMLESVSRDAVPVAPPRTVEEVVLEVDSELWAVSVQECQELIEAIDKEIFALEASTQPKANLNSLFRAVHTLKGAVSAVGLKPTATLLHQVEDFLEKLVEATILPSMKNVATFMLAVQDELRLNLRQARSGKVDTSHAVIGSWAARIMSGGLERPSAPDSSRPSSRVSRVFGGSSVRSGLDSDDLGDRRFIRVSTDRLDELMNLAGELVVNRSRLLNRVGTLKSLHRVLGDTRQMLMSRVDDFRSQYEFANIGGSRVPQVSKKGRASSRIDAQFGGFSDLELDRYEDVHILARSLAEIADDLTETDVDISRELTMFSEDSESFSFVISRIQSEMTRTRMTAVDSLFARLRLPIRDAAENRGKEVEVKLTQNEVSLDKTIIDALFEPMLHLVRNAVYHGIEATSDARTAAGKAPKGQISLRARQEAGQIVIEVADDGVGLNLAALKELGVKAGLVSQETPLADPAIKNLVFAPRLSTADAIDSIAGRGVGGDVVKRAIERLNGEIQVESTPGQGTVFSITLPMTLLITPALLFRSSQQTYAVPLFFAERIIEVEDRAMVDVLGSAQLKVGDDFIAVRRLEQVFGSSQTPRVGPVVVLRIGDRRLALQVDTVLVREEIVVKNMGRVLGGHPLFAGVTLRGSGDLLLILDVPGLMDHERVGHRGTAPVKAAVAQLPQSVRTSASDESVQSQHSEQATPVGPGANPIPLPDSSAVSAVSSDQPKAAQPAPAPVAAVAPVVVGPPVAQRAPDSGKRRVLFVDDSVSVRKVAERSLLELGVEVTLAVDGVDALEKLRRGDIDMIFTDLEMPRMHGFELIREVRFIPRFKDLPIVVISSRSGSKHQDQARALGATDYLTKPFTMQVLEGVMTRLLKDWKRRP